MAHIPDGFLSAPVAAVTLASAGVLTAYAARRAHSELDERAAPTLGLATAAVFAAQAANFPVAAGTSGHLAGGLLVAAIFGPWSGFLVMTAVLIAQALLFADGGVTALGANALNIGGVGCLLGYAIYRLLTGLAGSGALRRGMAAATAAYAAMVLTGVMAGVELGLSGTAPLEVSVAAMGGVYAIIGMAEAAISGLVVWALARKRADLLYGPRGAATTRPTNTAILAGLGAVAFLGGLLALLASTAPDSLERLAAELGFAEAAASWRAAPFQEYRLWLPGPAGTALAVVLGVALLFAGVVAMARAIGRAGAAREG